MTIYRCDKCKKEVTDITDIYGIRVLTEKNEYVDESLVWCPHRQTMRFDVCDECARNILQTFVNQFKEEGEIRNAKTESDTGHGD